MRLFRIQLSVLLSSVLLRQVSSMVSMNTKIVDSHLHVWAPSSKSNEYPYASGQTPPDSLIDKASAEELLSCMSDSGVDGALIVQPINHLYDHRYVADTIKKYPHKFKGMMLHDPTLDKQDAVDRLEELVLQGFVGVRFNPYLFPAEKSGEAFGKMSGESGLEVYKRCAELNVPVGIMCFKGLDLHYDDIINLLEQSPETTMVLDHMGFAALDYEDEKGEKRFEMLLSLAKYPNVHVKISALFRITGGDTFPFDRVKKERFLPLVEKYTVDRLLFGSDFPFVLVEEGGYKETLEVIQSWVGNEKDRAALLSGTAERLFGPWV